MQNNLLSKRKQYMSISPKRGNNNTDLLYYNRRLVLSLIQRHKVISRVELARLSGLKAATITIIVNELISKNLVEECGLIDGDNGRRVKGLSLVSNRFCTISLRITASYFAIALFDINSECIAVEKVIYDSYLNFHQTLVDIGKKIQQYSVLSGNLQILGISIGFQNDFLFDYDNGTVFYTAEDGKKIDIRAFFEGLSPYPVYIERSVDFLSYYVYTQNMISNIEDKIVLNIDISTSVDLGVLYHGELYHGAFSVIHCLKDIMIKTKDGNYESADKLINVTSVLNRARELLIQYPGSILNEKDIIYRDLINAYAIKDPLSVHLFTELSDYVAQLLVILIKLFAPHHILVGDEIPPSQEFFAMMKRKVQEYAGMENTIPVDISMVINERVTRRDATLLGGNAYVINMELPQINNEQSE